MKRNFVFFSLSKGVVDGGAVSLTMDVVVSEEDDTRVEKLANDSAEDDVIGDIDVDLR